MKTPRTTAMLSNVAMKARADRVRFTPPSDYFDQVTPTYAEIWFPTGGCFWDTLGHCTMCNYGAPADVNPDAMVRAVEIAAERIAPTTEMLWVSAFNSLQEREVPAEARRRIFDVIAQTPAKMVVTETHPASVRGNVLKACLEQLDGRGLGIELGVETMDEYVRYTCVNKPYSNTLLSKAVNTIHEAGALAWANLLLGITFLDADEVRADMVRSIHAAADLGFDRMMLFPNHVKPHTVAHLLASGERYTAPDMWLMRDVLAELPEELLAKVYLAWVDLKPHPGAPEIVFEPDPARSELLRERLLEFNWGRDRAVLNDALSLPRPELVVDTDRPPLVDRQLSAYEWLSENHGEPGWWAQNADVVRAELAACYPMSSLATATV